MIDGSGSSDDSSDDDAESEKEVDTSAPILDQTETNIIALRRTIYLTIQSSLDFEETVHKLMKLNLKPGHEMELCHMVCEHIYLLIISNLSFFYIFLFTALLESLVCK